MICPLAHETTYLRASLERRRAPSLGGGIALAGCLHVVPLPDLARQRRLTKRLPDRPQPRVQPPDRTQRHPHLQRAGASRGAGEQGSKRPHTIHRAFDPERAEDLRELLHSSPREFGTQRSLWTVDMAAESSFEGKTLQKSGLRARPSGQRLRGWEPAGSAPNAGLPAPSRSTKEKRRRKRLMRLAENNWKVGQSRLL